MMVRWISTDNRLPDDGVEVPIIVNGMLATGSYNRYGMMLDDDNEFCSVPVWKVGLDWETYSIDEVTHWLDGVVLPTFWRE